MEGSGLDWVICYLQLAAQRLDVVGLRGRLGKFVTFSALAAIGPMMRPPDIVFPRFCDPLLSTGCFALRISINITITIAIAVGRLHCCSFAIITFCGASLNIIGFCNALFYIYSAIDEHCVWGPRTQQFMFHASSSGCLFYYSTLPFYTSVFCELCSVLKAAISPTASS